MSALEKYQPRGPERLSREELEFIKTSDLIPKAYRGKPADMFAAILTGRSLGLSDMHALRSIYVVDGKATIGAELMTSLVRNHGHSIMAEAGDGFCTVTGKRRDNGDTMTVTWTRDMAAKAGLLGKDNWKKYEASMLWARAVSQLCRMLFPDVLTGMIYTPDEAELTAEERVSEAVGHVQVPPDDSVPDDSASAADQGSQLTAKVGESPASGSDTPDENPAPAATAADGEPDAVDANWHDVSETVPHTEDTAQGSVFEEMAQKVLGPKEPGE